jgi:hypothetical protein
MKYEVMKDCVIERVARKKGDIIEVTEDVVGLMGIGRIMPAVEPEIKVDRSVGLDTSDDKPKRRTKKAK